MITSIFSTIKNEFCKLFRQKIIIVVILIIPILINFLLGYEFSNEQIQNVPMVVYDQDNSSLSRMIVQQFEENETFDVKYFVNDIEEMKELFNTSKARTGMVIPKDFSKDMLNLKSPTIMMIYDGSHMSIAGAAKAKASEILITLKTGTVIKLLQGKLNLPADVAQKIALSIKFTNRFMYNPTKSFRNFLNPGFGVAIVQTGIVLMGAVAIVEEEIEKKKEKIGYLIGKIIFYSLIGWISFVSSILIQSKFFNLPFRGQMSDAMKLSALMSLSVATFSIMVSTWIKNKLLATQINAVLFVPNTVIVGYTWPVMSMKESYQVVAEYFPFYHYVDNIRDMYLKGTSLSKMTQDIEWFYIFIAVTFSISLIGILRLKAPDKSIVSEEEEEEAIVLS
ncbi:putative ABC transporter, type 2 [Gottschalkia acidurici 9a]|uniref:ABC transporter, type 2 n=1 Tax=Gottschalkia acidurici (strain ATCC 7906 / DSM 604 / BCRC 14475 / CIP 104303 / KCTC 5404 / NCIMB 10678 / 9a) TaxID=1128398 RepID=K0B1P2_GOTA9|nr:ABC transporter permease [Gottschalkia acidurici]AFS78865.1 putative ABC transporter, type 2 [Gottschalkia acidurici 9a]